MSAKMEADSVPHGPEFVRDVKKFENDICYSARYDDDFYTYRHVILPQELGKYVDRTRLLPEDEWRSLGIRQSPGWEHYMIHNPEPHILIFRRHRDNLQQVKAESKMSTSVQSNAIGGLAG